MQNYVCTIVPSKYRDVRTAQEKERKEKYTKEETFHGFVSRVSFVSFVIDLPVAFDPSIRRPRTNTRGVSISRNRSWSSGSYTRGMHPFVS